MDKASIHSAAENFALTIQTLRSKIPLEGPAKDRNFARAKDSTDVFPGPAPNYGLLPKDGTSFLFIERALRNLIHLRWGYSLIAFRMCLVTLAVMGNKAPEYTLLDHTADLGIKIRGTDLKDLFENAARALMHLMVRGGSRMKTTPMKLSVSGEDLADLMVRWLGEILYLFEGEKLVVSSIHLDSVTSSRVEATLETAPFDSKSHKILSVIKAVTYHQIEVAEKDGQWEARVIFDM